MGNKIDLAIIKNCDKESVKKFLYDWMATKGKASYIRPNECSFSQRNDATVVLLNYDSCLEGYDGFFHFVSKRTDGVVLAIYVYDSDYWGYCLYDAGKEIDVFCTCPELLLWSGASAEELQRYSGSSAIIAQYFKVSEDSIKNYLVPWTDENRKVKAYPDDEYGQEDWQIADFMKKLGYSYGNFEFDEETSSQEEHDPSVEEVLSQMPPIRTMLNPSQYGEVFYTTGWLPNALDSEYVSSILRGDTREIVKSLCSVTPSHACWRFENSIYIERSDRNLFILSAFCNLLNGSSGRYCFKKAFGNLCNALASDPNNIMLLRARSLTLAFDFNYRVYIDDLTKLLELDSDNTDVYLLSRAFFYYLDSKMDAAMADLNRLFDYRVPDKNDPRINYDAFSDGFMRLLTAYRDAIKTGRDFSMMDESTDMTFTLTINNEKYLNNINKKYPNDKINASVISDAITAFSKEYYAFIILEPKTPIEQSVFIQAAYPGKDNAMPVEIRFEYSDGSFKQYRYMTEDKAEIIQLFIDYWKENKVPDLTNWTDIFNDV